MATAAYMTGRKRYQRPEAVLWSNNSGTLTSGLYLPNGFEVGAVVPDGTNQNLIDQFLILSDNNRSEINFNKERIETRQRTINGRMRSYHIADKLNISWSWNMLPSRAYCEVADFDADGISPYKNQIGEFTTDGGAGGVAILDWYNSHPGPFWMYLAYDKYSNFKTDGEITDASFGHLEQYNEIIEVYFADFSYTVVKRGGSTYDFWNINVTLEEV